MSRPGDYRVRTRREQFQALNDVPQPQVFTASGLLKTKARFSRSS